MPNFKTIRLLETSEDEKNAQDRFEFFGESEDKVRFRIKNDADPLV